MADNKLIVPAGIVALGIAICGFFPGYYWHKTENEKLQDRNSVAVKGLAERTVQSNLATWKIKVWGNYNDWNIGKAGIEKKTEEVLALLKENGITDQEITQTETSRKDRYNTEEDVKKINRRYMIHQDIDVRTKQIDKIAHLMNTIGKLRTDEIDLDLSEITYHYFDLNKIKPEMLQEALNNAKASAKKFAEQSGLSVGRIKTASQGTFEIEAEPGCKCPGEEYYWSAEKCSKNKVVRVVSTIEYYLE